MANDPSDDRSVDIEEAIKGKRPSDDQDHVCSDEEKLDESLEDSMDASDPPSPTHPDDHGEPAPSSGFRE